MVELQHTADTITGTVSVVGATPTEFYGWLELISLLDRAVAEDAPADGRTDEGEST